eukprot:SAG31_NODE_3928_length_3745_cov_1.460505_4_plen_143_part_00
MITTVNNGMVSGINGVEWDAVELPSQFMENWLYSTYEMIESVSGHHETGEPLPKQLWEKVVAAKTHMAGQMMLRQLFFGLVDMQLHLRPASTSQETTEPGEVLNTFRKVAEEYTVLPVWQNDCPSLAQRTAFQTHRILELFE